jgi:neutral ceramidase
MNKPIILGLLLIVTVILPCRLQGQYQTNQKSLYKIGVSQVKITPETPTLMSGYSSRKTPFTGVHDDIFASALFFSGETSKALIITSDLIGFPSAFVDDLKKTISSKIGVPADNIMITAVHNHGGPVTKTYESNTPQSVDDYIKVLREKLINLSAEAAKNPVPFRMGIGKSSCNMNINRRASFANGSVGLGRNPDGPCDHDLVVARFENLNGKLLALLVNWPCHGTASSEENFKITGDWPGAASRYIKNHTDKEVIVAITAGASADINPLYESDYFKEIEAIGFHAGVAACKALEGIKTYPVKTLQVTNAVLSMPGKKSGKDDFPPASFESAPPVELRLTAMKIGDLVISGVSGELMTEIGMAVKKQSPYSGTIIVTHCNGSSGYICTDKAYTEGGYEVRVTRMMPGVEKPLTDKLLEMIRYF